MLDPFAVACILLARQDRATLLHEIKGRESIALLLRRAIEDSDEKAVQVLAEISQLIAHTSREAHDEVAGQFGARLARAIQAVSPTVFAGEPPVEIWRSLGNDARAVMRGCLMRLPARLRSVPELAAFGIPPSPEALVECLTATATCRRRVARRAPVPEDMLQYLATALPLEGPCGQLPGPVHMPWLGGDDDFDNNGPLFPHVVLPGSVTTPVTGVTQTLVSQGIPLAATFRRPTGELLEYEPLGKEAVRLIGETTMGAPFDLVFGKHRGARGSHGKAAEWLLLALQAHRDRRGWRELQHCTDTDNARRVVQRALKAYPELSGLISAETRHGIWVVGTPRGRHLTVAPDPAKSE